MLVGLLTLGQLSCDNHPFFEGLHLLLENMKICYNNVLSTEGNIRGLYHDVASVQEGSPKWALDYDF